jgi:PAS domain S-box-containing protein
MMSNQGKNEKKNHRSILNVIIIALMVFMAAFTSLFIYSNIHLKNRVTYRIVQQTEFLSDLISRSVVERLSHGHQGGLGEALAEHESLIGVQDITIFGMDGVEAFTRSADEESGVVAARRKLSVDEAEHFRKAVETLAMTGYFNHAAKTYERYEPLLADAACLKCHPGANDALGVLKFSISTKDDFQVLEMVQRFIWLLGVIVCLPLGGIIVTGAIIKDKNKLYNQLHESSENLRKTNHDLNDTKYYLEMILNNSKAIIITTDTEGRIVEFNREAQSLLEYDKHEVAGKDVRMLYENPDERDALEGEKGRVWAARNREVAMKSKSGKIVHVSLTLSTLQNDMGEIIGTVGVGKDISEQKMLQFKLLQSEKLAGIGTLASGIAHEINNPLAGILGMAEAIKDEDDMATIKAYTDDIIQYSLNASVIVKELSAYSRTARNEATSTVDLSQIIENSVKMAKHASPFLSISEDFHLEKESYIFANTGEMQQVYVNLIVNAIHAMQSSGTLTLACRHDGNFVSTMVKDSGTGIPPENLTQIFDPFFTTKPAGSGTGLGLYVVYKIVTKYGGTIDVSSKPGEGAAFMLKFPAAHGFESRALKAD